MTLIFGLKSLLFAAETELDIKSDHKCYRPGVLFHDTTDESLSFTKLRDMLQITDSDITSIACSPSADDQDMANLHPLGCCLNLLAELCDPTESSTIRIVELYQGAARAKVLVDKLRPEVVIGLGRTPTLLLEGLRALYSQDQWSPKFIHMAFSGCPDIRYPKKNTMNKVDHVDNVLTEERKNVFFDYLRRQGLSAASGEILIIDMIGFGSGLNSFLCLLRGFYNDEKVKLPVIRFLGMNLRQTDDRGFCKFDSVSQVIAFPANADFCFRPISISTFPLGMSDYLIKWLDNDSVALRCAAVPEYRAWQMTSGTMLSPAPHYNLFSKFVEQCVLFLHRYGTKDFTETVQMRIICENLQNFFKLSGQGANIRNTVVQTWHQDPNLVWYDKELDRVALSIDLN